MIKTYCDRCGEDKTSYASLGYYITVSHTHRKDLCKKCMNEVSKLIKDFMKLTKRSRGEVNG